MSQQKEKKYFASPDGRLNSDDADVACGLNEWCLAENLRSGTTDGGATAVMESVWGTVLRSTPEPSVSHMELGSAVDLENNRILYFLKDLYGAQDKIKCVYISDDSEYTVVRAAQIDGGLGFHKYHPIHSAKVVHGLLVWTDGYGEPRKLNIDAGIKLNHPDFNTDERAYPSSIPYVSTTLIKRPPIYRLQVEKINDNTFENNFIQGTTYQFCYRYWYRDFDYSVLSTYAQLLPYNSADDDTANLNAVTVSLPLIEDIDDDVQQVDVCVRYGNEGKTFVVKSWNKRNTDDASAITAHNDNTTALSFTFYDNTRGEALDTVTANLPFDNIALRCETIEFADSRLFMGNLLKGYDTPATTSLSLSLGEYDTGGGGTYLSDWKYFYLPYVSYDGLSSGTVTFYYLYQSALTEKAWFFDADKYNAIPDGSYNAVDATTHWATETELAAWVMRNVAPPSGNRWQSTGFTFYDTSSDTNLVFVVDLNGLQFFKSGSLCKVSIAFYDRYRRKTGVVSKYVELSIPIRTYDQSVFATNIGWTLSNTLAEDEIPEEAHYYQIHISRNQTFLSFVQTYAMATYVKKNTDGAYDYTPTTFDSLATYGVAFDMGQLNPLGIGYVFTEGDKLRHYKTDGTSVLLNVLAQDGAYVIASPVDLGTLAPTNKFIEIYTPYLPSVTEPFYETGDMMAVLDPGTTSRQYGTTSGTINGDCYAIQRTTSGSATYFVEAMSPRDKNWSDWQVDRGWVNYVDTIGQVDKPTTVDWTGTYVQGTKINGLNKFASSKSMSSECGAINKLQLAAKVSDDPGDVMLALCANQPLSLYIGEVQLYGANRAADLAQTADVIGTVNALKGEWGCTDPTSVAYHEGAVRWFCASRGKWVQYASNGLFPFSDYKMSRFWSLFAAQYNSMTKEEIEALGSRPFIFSAVDPKHSELLISIPKLLSAPPKGYLPDYPSEVYPFDLWDGTAQTLVYKLDLGLGNPHWQGRYTFAAEGFTVVQNRLFSYKNGFLYEHNQRGSTSFYGTSFKARLAFYGNLFGGLPKVVQNLSLESNLCPTWAYVRSEVPYQQATDLLDYEWKDLEGVWYAAVKRNKLTPTAYGMTTTGILSGEKMRAVAFRLLLEFTLGDTPLQLRQLTIGYQISRGHKNIITN